MGNLTPADKLPYLCISKCTVCALCFCNNGVLVLLQTFPRPLWSIIWRNGAHYTNFIKCLCECRIEGPLTDRRPRVVFEVGYAINQKWLYSNKFSVRSDCSWTEPSSPLCYWGQRLLYISSIIWAHMLLERFRKVTLSFNCNWVVCSCGSTVLQLREKVLSCPWQNNVKSRSTYFF